MSIAEDPPETSPVTRTGQATRLLRLASNGDDGAAERLMELLYGDLRRLAGRLLRGERANHTLQATALVHEAWLRMFDNNGNKDGLAHMRRRFLSYAAQSMRRVLIDYARARASEKRGGKAQVLVLAEELLPGVEDAQDHIDLDEALTELASRRARAAHLAELRIFGGLSMAEAAGVIEMPLSTAKSEWDVARAFLSSRLADKD